MLLIKKIETYRTLKHLQMRTLGTNILNSTHRSLFRRFSNHIEENLAWISAFFFFQFNSNLITLFFSIVQLCERKKNSTIFSVYLFDYWDYWLICINGSLWIRMNRTTCVSQMSMVVRILHISNALLFKTGLMFMKNA